VLFSIINIDLQYPYIFSEKSFIYNEKSGFVLCSIGILQKR